MQAESASKLDLSTSSAASHNNSGTIQIGGKTQKIFYPCNFCEFEATSARQLSRHKAVTHVKNPLSCVLCPFVTAYQTNLLRHRREVHGILGSRGNKSCKFCGFEADDNDTLILHQKQAHEDILNSARERFAREKKTARGNVPNHSNGGSVNGDSPDTLNANADLSGNNISLNNSASSSKKRSSTTAQLARASNSLKKYAVVLGAPNIVAPPPQSANNNGLRYSFGDFGMAQSEEEEDENDFWKEGFIDNPPSLVNFNYSEFHADRIAAMAVKAAAEAVAAAAQQQQAALLENAEHDKKQSDGMDQTPVEMNPLDEKTASQIAFYGDFSPNHSVEGSEYESSRPSTPLFTNAANNISSKNENANGTSTLNSSQNSDSLASAAKESNLAPTRIRRQYNCPDCLFNTVNPREYLYHRRDSHEQKIKIVECPYCVYACQYFQKLQRHMLLVHKLETSITPPGDQSPGAQTANGAPAPSSLVSQSTNGTNGANGSSLLRRAVQGSISKNQFGNTNSTTSKLRTDIGIDQDEEEEEQMQPDEMDPDLMVDLSAKLFCCEDCDYVSNVKYLYDKHFRYHQNKPRSCDKCDFASRYPPSFEAHTSAHGATGAFTCDKCDFATEFEREINVHFSTHHHTFQKDEEMDEDDQMNGMQLKHLNSQMSSHFDDDDLMHSATAEEDEVDEDNIDEQLLRPHTSLTIKQDKDDNQQSLSKSQALNVANGKHGPLSLSVRGGTLGGISYIRKPNKPSIGSSLVNMKSCKHCPFKTDTYSKLEKHEACFHREASFQCPMCETPFDALPQLQQHLTTFHREDKQAGNIVNILEMLYPRSVRSNNSNDAVEGNRMSNSAGEAAFSRCHLCGYTTRWRSELQKHMRVHTDLRPFACPHCDYRCKWKGDMNRHILKFHRGAPITKVQPISTVDTVPAMEEDNGATSSLENGETESESNLRPNADSKVKVYKCTFCEFACSTASRFHVHYVQHLNTKPFMCSVCQHRSNWEWDVTKHIKMKSQRDSDHLNAHPVLIHDSGKRNYSKYDEFLQLIPVSELANLESNDKREMGDSDEHALTTEEDPESIVITPDINFSFANESSATITNPSVVATSTPQQAAPTPVAPTRPAKLFYCAYCDYTHRDSKSLVSHLSVHAGRKPFKCKLCGFSSNWREVLNRHVASRHNGAGADIEQLFKYTVSKYICRIIDETGLINPGPEVTTQADVRQPGQESNVDSPAEPFDVRSMANKSSSNIEESLLNAANKQLPNDPNSASSLVANNLSLINTLLTQQFFSPIASQHSKSTFGVLNSSQSDASCSRKEQTSDAPQTPQVLAKHGISGRVSGFKGTFKCVICPFRAEKSFHMDFHLKRHTQLPGADFKCPQCPYWVNAKKSLVKHIYLHRFENEIDDESADPDTAADTLEEANSSNNESSVARFQNIKMNCGLHCTHCPFVGTSKTQLMQHLQFHRPARHGPFRCSTCSFEAIYEPLLWQHLKVHLPSYRPVCPCKSNNTDDSSLGGEEEQPDSERQAEEMLADIPFLTIERERDGQKEQVKAYTCRFCSVTSEQVSFIKSHQQKHLKSGETFKCSTCGLSTRDPNAYLLHTRSHEKDSNDQEPIRIRLPVSSEQKRSSNQAFVKLEPKSAEYRRISPSKSIRNETSPRKRSNETTPKLSCYEDSLRFIHSLLSQQQFGDGVLINVEDIRYAARRVFTYICSSCPAAFKSANDLAIHAILHESQSKSAGHCCLYCSYRATNKPRLIKHLLVHTPEYVARRANCYPEGQQIVVGEAYRMMRNEIRTAPEDQEPVDEEMFTQSLKEQPIDSILKDEVADLDIVEPLPDEEDPICDIAEGAEPMEDEADALDDAVEVEPDFEMPEVEMEMAECEGEIYTAPTGDDDEDDEAIPNEDDSN